MAVWAPGSCALRNINNASETRHEATLFLKIRVRTMTKRPGKAGKYRDPETSPPTPLGRYAAPQDCHESD